MNIVNRSREGNARLGRPEMFEQKCRHRLGVALERQRGERLDVRRLAQRGTRAPVDHFAIGFDMSSDMIAPVKPN